MNRALHCKKPQKQFVLPQGPKQSSRHEVHQGIQMVVSIGVQQMIQQHHSGAQLPPLNTATKYKKLASTQTPRHSDSRTPSLAGWPSQDHALQGTSLATAASIKSNPLKPKLSQCLSALTKSKAPVLFLPTSMFLQHNHTAQQVLEITGTALLAPAPVLSLFRVWNVNSFLYNSLNSPVKVQHTLQTKFIKS